MQETRKCWICNKSKHNDEISNRCGICYECLENEAMRIARKVPAAWLLTVDRVKEILELAHWPKGAGI